MRILKSNIEPAKTHANIASFVRAKYREFPETFVVKERDNSGSYVGITWKELYKDIVSIASNLKKAGFSKGDKVILFSRNSVKMLEAELSVMASGGTAVPIFAFFKSETAELLIRHSGAKYIFIEGAYQNDQLRNLKGDFQIWSFDDEEYSEDDRIKPFKELLTRNNSVDDDVLFFAENSTDICLNMYTSGTMGIPKSVQISHKNILSQQASLSKVWSLNSTDRFLSYLPWHHSFGGIFELFTALNAGATIHLESSGGKSILELFANWEEAKPTVFFSVPRVYQGLIELASKNQEAENFLFNSGLKFVFTAASPLQKKLSDEFESRGIPVIEGWGLTETSPCCTLTDPTLKRESGVVGLPIPGVEIRIGDEDEIQVKGDNVMCGYYNNDEANKDVFTEDGWYKTGDTGAILDSGLKLISRKDRIFKLSNGEKVVPTDIEKLIELQCHYVQYAVIGGSGEDYPVALIFPKSDLINNPNYENSPEDGCFCPRSLAELSKCLRGCLGEANCGIGQKFSKIKAAAIVSSELSLDDMTLTPSLKVAPKRVLEKYKNHLRMLYGEDYQFDEEVYIIQLDELNEHSGKIV